MIDTVATIGSYVAAAFTADHLADYANDQKINGNSPLGNPVGTTIVNSITPGIGHNGGPVLREDVDPSGDGPGGPEDPKTPSPAAAAAFGQRPTEDALQGANRAEFEVYKDGLRANMERPVVSDSRLSSLLDELYRPNATVGNGSTAAAVRQELATGEPVAGRMHSQKAENMVMALERWLERNPAARPGDRAAAENVIRDMQNAIRPK